MTNLAAPGTHCELSTATQLEFCLASYPFRGHPLLIRSNSIPEDAVPAQLTDLGNDYRLNWNSTPPPLGSPPPDSPATSFLEHLRTLLPEWQQELLVGVFQMTAHDTLGQHLVKGDRLYLCSADSAKDN